MSAVPARSQQGFSLIEIVVAIVIMSIIAIGLVDYITNSATGYVQASARNQVSAAGRVVTDRLVMELHNALPESVRVFPSPNPRTTTNADYYAGDQCLEFVPVLAASSYIDPAIRPDARKTTFDVVEFVPEQDDVTGVYVVVYPTSEADLYAASFSGNTTEAIAGATVEDADDMDGIGGTAGPDGINEITTTTNHRFKRASSAGRIFLTSQPVSYCITGSKLYRYSNYGFHEDQPIPVRPAGTCAAIMPATCLPATTPNRVLVTDQLDNSALTGGSNGQAFDQVSASRRRNAVVQLEFNFRQGSQEVRLNHEVLQQATP